MECGAAAPRGVRGFLEVDGHRLQVRYHHLDGKTWSRSRSGGRWHNVPSVAPIVNRSSRFVQFYSVEGTTRALNGMERECRCRLDGQKVLAGYAK